MLEENKAAIENGRSRDTCNIGQKTQNKDKNKQTNKHNTENKR